MHILVKLKSALEEAGYTEEQWKELDEKTKKQYIKDHPNSKYAQKDKPSEKKAPKDPAQKPISKERPTSFPNVNVEIDEWKDDADSVGGTYDEDAKDIEYWLDQMYNIKDAKYGTDGDKNFVSVQNPNDGKIYNIVIDHSGVDIMNEDMSDSVLNEHTDLTNGNGYIDRYETEKYGLGLPTVRALTDLGFGQELDYHDFNQPADIDNVKVDEPEDEFLDDEGNMTTEQAKRYWKNHHDDDPILQDYDSFEDWYKESKENGYIKDEVVEKEQYPYTDDKSARYTDYFGKNEKSVDRPKEYFSGELTIDNWEDKPAKDSYFKDEMSYIGQGIKDAIGANSSGRLDIKYADGEDKDNAFISIADKDTGIIYNVIIDSYGIDIMDEDMTDSYLAGEVENGYFEPNDLESVVQFLKKDILGNEDEDDYTEDDSEVMTTDEAKEYWKNNRTSDPILEDYDSFEDWYKESKENGYIKD